jgi:RHS repeat-associated protein
MIGGKEVMLKNKSNFSKSSGDEAGSAPKKGVVTSKNMGKVYFNAWSMDVKVEGENVCRNLDITTHNHMSTLPGNTPPMPHVSSLVPPEVPECEICKSLPTCGMPVNPILGCKLLEGESELDFVIEGLMPLLWQRTYFSNNKWIGGLGQGWALPIEQRFEVEPTRFVFVDTQGRRIAYPRMQVGDLFFHEVERCWLERSAVATLVLRQNDGSQLVFSLGDEPALPQDAVFRLCAIIDRNGNQTSISYVGDGRADTIILPGDRRLSLNWSGDRLSRVDEVRVSHTTVARAEASTALARVPLVTYQYNEHGDLVRVLDRAGHPAREFEWDNHMLVMHRVPGAEEARYVWDEATPRGKVQRHTTSLGKQWVYDYGADRTTVTDQDGRREIYLFDTARQWIGTIGPTGQVTRRVLDGRGRLLAVVDAEGRGELRELDELGRPVRQISANGAITEILWHPRLEKPLALIDPIGRQTRFAYDAVGNLLTHTEPDGSVTRYEYDDHGLVVALTEPNGAKLHFAYDERFRLASATDSSGSATRFEYDENDWLVRSIDALGGVTQYRYNGSDLKIAEVLPDGSETRYEYDQAHRLRSVIDAHGRETQYELRADGLPERRIDPSGRALEYHYDHAGRLLRLENENGAAYHLAYDALDRLVEERGFDDVVTKYAYDGSGFLVELSVGTPAGPVKRLQFQYDAAGQLLRTIGQHGVLEEFRYDEAGQMLAAINELGRVDFEYDEQGRLIAEQVDAAGLRTRVERRYDASSNVTSIGLCDGRRLNLLYYGSGHLHQVNLDDEALCDFERDGLHREVTRSQGALKSRFDYDAVGRLRQSVAAKIGDATVPAPIAASAVLIRRQYQYGRNGDLLALRDSARRQKTFSFDNGEQLVVAAGESGRELFHFDPARNLVDSAGQIVGSNRVTVHGDRRYKYDAIGRVIEKRIGSHTVIRMDWDELDQIIAVQRTVRGSQQTFAYQYDALGRRIQKIDSFGTTRFSWDADRLLEEIRGARAVTYVYKPDEFEPVSRLERQISLESIEGGISVVSPHAQATSSASDAGGAEHASEPMNVLHFHCDHIGTPQELTDVAGNIVWRAHYRAFGSVVRVEYLPVTSDADEGTANAGLLEERRPGGRSNGSGIGTHPVGQPLRFAGQYCDPETGLHYNRFRYYDPDIGRYLSQDPVGLLGGTNPYEYGPNPVMYIDPLGLLGFGALDTHGVLKKVGNGFQSHHLNQDAVYRDHIEHKEGEAILLKGNAFKDCCSSHYKAHKSLEKFWDQYRDKTRSRPAGKKFGTRPTNRQYSQALRAALKSARVKPSVISRAVACARAQRANAGLDENDRVPRIPGRINQSKC